MALMPNEFYRGLIWLLLANALGYTAANSLQRSLRTQFAQSLVLQQLLSTDAMTGIANRRRFDAALEREWRRCQRAGAPLSMLMIDVDHFKAYNDHCGHPQGDACLRQVARLLFDTIGRPGDLVARYGGEEFICLLPEIGMAGALSVANKLSAALRHADIAHPRSPAGPRLTISIGVATAKNLSGRPKPLVAYADKLLYAAKAAGRNQVKVGQFGVKAAAAQAA
jgi:diguanylate cyclase (GGDEF)-like protein